jgi:xylulokinase
MGVSLTAGGALQWWRKALTPLLAEEPDIRVLSVLAGESPAGSRGLRFLPYLVGERCPQVDPDARGAWIGLDLRHDITDMTRAIVEGALLNLRQTRDLFAGLGLPVDDLRVSGGASVHPIWSQTLADTFRTPVKTVTGGEHGAAYGAALLAMVGSGRWNSLGEALTGITVTSKVEPVSGNADALDEAYSDFLKLYPALKGSNNR